ncbi:TetR/AcrR family transcriptional regulator [Acetanaerobacterium elongatum]|uniref:Transcriptional regulator, TetR family n=1 Tax=Acetanaerobacterium elongatum TaxID=258515 RepID=A0A1H0CTM0_9FIRM|nr:TetR/AcrR family transcriptional regulator [Acetanaerobacterium elongatum]SDN61219.1 transcriptional regulator, TetR family [Acetanaerobacterium elongatum]
MIKELSDTDLQIIEAARELFIKNGFEKTEMKDIARKIGIGRSTLYRHFENKSAIIFYIAQQELEDITSVFPATDISNAQSGYEAVKRLLRALNDKLLANIDKVTFLRDFDFAFTGEYPNDEMAKSYLVFLRSNANSQVLTMALQSAMDDGSITTKLTAGQLSLTLTNSCLAMAQRVLPREQHYNIEHGISRELLSFNLDILLRGIR